MGIYIGYERKKFERTQAQLRKQYEAAGMTEEQIQQMYELDLHQFNRDIAYMLHTQTLDLESWDDTDPFDCDRSELRRKFEDSFTVCQKPTMTTLFWWLDEIDNDEAVAKLKKLTYEEKLLIDCLIFKEMTQENIGVLLQTTQASISRRVALIRRKLKVIFQTVVANRDCSFAEGGEE